MDVHLDITWHLGRGDTHAVSSTLFEILRAVDEQGSVTAAARSAGISYRSAWNLLQQWSSRLGQDLVIMERGRGSVLSCFGRKLLWAKDYTREQTETLLAQITTQLRRELDRVDTSATTARIRVVASHCLTHPLLRKAFRERTGQDLHIENAGSARALERLVDGGCDIAGFHVAEGGLRSDFVHHYRGRIDPADYTLIRAGVRRQGLIVARRNPKNIREIRDLARSGVCMVNRQPESGTRLLLDAMLRQAVISPTRLTGYDTEEYTHSAVGALVASGAVDVGLGTEASAHQFGLEFVGLADETYYYAVATVRLREPGVAKFVVALGSEDFRERARTLAGYDPSNSGQQIPAPVVLA